MTHFELKFNSSKGDFSLNVENVAVLTRTLIPATYLAPQTSTITTTDQEAISQISEALLSSPITSAGETECALLVQANGSRWIIFGVRSNKTPSEDENSSQAFQIKARMINPHALNGIHIPTLDPGQSKFLSKKVHHALDGHQVKAKGRKRSAAEVVGDTSLVSPAAVPEIVPEVSPPIPKPAVTPVERSVSAKFAKAKSMKKAELIMDSKEFKAAETLEEKRIKSVPDTPSDHLQHSVEKAVKDKLKKMIVTLLSLQGITKSSPDFKDLYQHSLQASVFALRSADTDTWSQWEAQAMVVNQNLIKMFLGKRYKEN